MDNLKPMENPPHAQPETVPVVEAESAPRRRPFGVTLLVWLVLSLSAWGLLRLAAALRWWDVLYDKEARLSPLYLSITGAGWAVAGIVLLWSIWSLKRWAYLALPISALVWVIQYWIERIFFQGPRPNLPFTIFGTGLILLIAFGLAFNRRTKTYLTKSEEHEQPQDSSTT